MARYIPGMMGPIKGSVGSDTYSKNRYGYYVKKKPIPTNPNTTPQAEVRSYMTLAVSSWQNALTAAQRASWEHAASLHKRAAWGYGFVLSGFNLYCAHYVAMEKCSEAPILVPTIFEGAPPIELPTIGDDAAGQKEITAWVESEANYVLMLRHSPTTTLGVNYRNVAFNGFTYAAAGFVGNVGIGSSYPASGVSYREFLGARVMDKRGAISGLLEWNVDGTMV